MVYTSVGIVKTYFTMPLFFQKSNYRLKKTNRFAKTY